MSLSSLKGSTVNNLQTLILFGVIVAFGAGIFVGYVFGWGDRPDEF